MLGISSQYRPVSRTEKEALLGSLIDAEPAFLDTATVYGQDTARMNPILGACLAARSAQLPIVNKVGAALGEEAALAPRLIEEFEQGLSELRLEGIDTTLVHRSSVASLGRDAPLHAHLRRTGKSRRFGICSHDAKVLEAYCAEMQVDVLQTPLNLLDYAAARPVLAKAAERGVEVQARSLLASGLLGGRYEAEDATRFAADRRRFGASERSRSAFRARIGKMHAIRDYHARLREEGRFEGDLGDFCHAAIAASPEVHAVVLGGSTRDQLTRNLALPAHALPADLAQEVLGQVEDWAAPYA